MRAFEQAALAAGGRFLELLVDRSIGCDQRQGVDGLIRSVIVYHDDGSFDRLKNLGPCLQ